MKKIGKASEKKSREQMKQEKIMNAAMHKTSAKTAKGMEIVAVHPEESIFQTKPKNGKSAFIKIFSIKGLNNSDMRKSTLLHSLCENVSSRRIRISSFQYSGNKAPVFFLSVYFYGSSYADIYEEVQEFNAVLEMILQKNSRIMIETCSMSDIFMFIYMNYNVQVKKISEKSILEKNCDWRREYLKVVAVKDNGIQLADNGRYGCCYMAIQYPDDIAPIFEKIKEIGCVILSCVDIQRIPEKYIPAYKEYIEQIYSGSIESEKSNLLNATFLFCVFTNSKEELETCNRLIKEHMENNKLLVTNCRGMEEMVFNSIATMGLLDFHCMRNINQKIIANLLI